MTDELYPRIAVLLPAYNEEATIAEVVSDYQKINGNVEVYVFDNNSTDRTSEFARNAGAIVAHEPKQGKGNVVRRMFADVDADVYLMADADGTYDAASSERLIDELVQNNLDMVVGVRVSDEKEAYRTGHRAGNKFLNGVVKVIFSDQFTDMLSGFRVFSRRFVKSFPADASGFEIETELTIHALEMRLPIKEIPTPYMSRPEGSVSKLRTYQDGFKILYMIIKLLKREKPFAFFGWVSVLLAMLAIVLFIPVLYTFLETGLVPRLPTAILSATLMIFSLISATAGIILKDLSRTAKEAKRLTYLSIQPPGSATKKD
ncbi:MAG: glycosyltransferase family 2 protein [Sedimenticola sp.]